MAGGWKGVASGGRGVRAHAGDSSRQRDLARTKTLVAEERRISADVLHHLREIERGRLYAEAGFSSLFSYCVEELKYFAGSAYRRINAMRLMRECPGIEDSIRDGSLTVSTASAVQKFVTEKPCSTEDKQKLIEDVKGKNRNPGELLEWMADQLLQKIEPRSTSPANETARQSSGRRYIPAALAETAIVTDGPPITDNRAPVTVYRFSSESAARPRPPPRY